MVDRRYTLLIEGKKDVSSILFVSCNFVLKRTSHILVTKFLEPLRISFPRKYIINSSLLNVASHPASHNCPRDKSEAVWSWGKIRAMTVSRGRSGMGR